MSSRANVILDLQVERFTWMPWEEPVDERDINPAILAAADGPRRLAAGTASTPALVPEVEPAPPPALPDFETLRQEHQARLAALERDAFTKGYAQGERAGMEAGSKRAEAMLRRVAQTVEELGALRHTLAQQSERQMVQLALMVARRIVHREVSLDPELVAAMAHVALQKLSASSPATIRLNPDDYTVVARASERWTGSQVTVVPDPAVARGGCLVESEFGRIDATLDRQFDEMARALLGSQPADAALPTDPAAPGSDPHR